MGVPLEDRLVLIRSLTRHRIFDPDTKECLGDQTRGQLMGSPTSFPILCIMNLALTRHALELSAHRQLELAELPILVNGDDLLFRAHPWEYRIWEQVTRLGGLRPSLGKNYISSKYFTINSELWCASTRFHKVDTQVTPYFLGKKLTTVLWGQLYGSVKGRCNDQGEVSLFSPGRAQILSSRSDCWHSFLRSCENPVRGYDLLWEAHRSYLQKVVPGGMCYSLPVHLGGAGFPMPPRASPTWLERKASSYQLAKARLFLEREATCVRFLRRFHGELSQPSYLEAHTERENQLRRALRMPKWAPAETDTAEKAGSSLFEASLLPLWAFYHLGVTSVADGRDPFDGDNTTSVGLAKNQAPMGPDRQYSPQAWHCATTPCR